ncbi:hypothetical protein HN385_02765 [archaeon]|jgi:hypothetical protein|nr:hypothetical protein [archaeon]MBT3450673.1 hypothetical protein [archaeon]MBT6868747.1 hypothetical protein [archaeon]MBT7193032.1 hypothetical protein [archaeon]MBT7380998.1 hypothetical protein [archaeon]
MLDFFGDPIFINLKKMDHDFDFLYDKLTVILSDQNDVSEEELDQVFSLLKHLYLEVQALQKIETDLIKKKARTLHLLNTVKQINPFDERYLVYIKERKLKHKVKVFLKDMSNFLEDIKQSKKKLISAEEEEREEKKLKKKAKKLAKLQLSHFEKGCYHYTDGHRVKKLIDKGIVSIKYAEEVLKEEIKESVGNYQGKDYISVFDTYTYFRIYLSLKKKGLVEDAINGLLTEDQFIEILKENPDLNIMNNFNANLKIIRELRLFDRRTFAKFFRESMIYMGELNKFLWVNITVGQITFLIDDTMQFFPEHDNAFAYEGLFEGMIPTNKIIGIIDLGKGSLSIALEFGKITGVPVYEISGKLIWPI